MGYERLKKSNFEDYPGTKSLIAWIRIRIVFAWIQIRIRIKVRSGSGSVTNFVRPWIRIRIKMIRIRHTAVLRGNISDECCVLYLISYR